ncbi:transposase [Moorena sp. SIO4G3]|uniref:transposase n=1 Tax=Moorena sp. SIO4G3 TaxID=2607821 RepID=UPI0025D689EC|nr:transposase [Moorena sp. SIO4G3]
MWRKKGRGICEARVTTQLADQNISNSTQIHHQLLDFLRQYSNYRDLRHLKTLAWMVSALISSGQLSLSAWEPYVSSRAKLAQSFERRWHRFVSNRLISVKRLYIPLVLLALKDWYSHRLYLALDTTVLWNRYCMIHLSVVCCGRAVPFLWQVLEHSSATVAFEEYQPLLRQARWILREHADVMLLADRGFANHALMYWLQGSNWHYCLRLPCDIHVHGPRRYPTRVSHLWPPKGEALLYHHVGLWQDGEYRCHLVLANVKGVKEPWAVMTDETPSLKTLWQYGLRFRVEELFLDSKSGAKEARRLAHPLGKRSRATLPRRCCGSTLRHDSGHGRST